MNPFNIHVYHKSTGFGYIILNGEKEISSLHHFKEIDELFLEILQDKYETYTLNDIPPKFETIVPQQYRDDPTARRLDHEELEGIIEALGLEMAYSSPQNRYLIPRKQLTDLLSEVDDYLASVLNENLYREQGEEKGGFIFLEYDEDIVLTPMPGQEQKPDFSLEKLDTAKTIDIYVSKYECDNEECSSKIDVHPPPFAYIAIKGTEAAITTNKAYGWTINTLTLEDLFAKYVPKEQN
ncbi:hypothetical protein GF367_03585 [Candidatus Woesearchaeota archaeon]|nr:hypothetical protein [Candidatus Woesearchaeota archaeon]